AVSEELQPAVNVQIGAQALDTRAIRRALVRDVLVVMPSVEDDSVELIAAAADGRTMIQRTRRNGADLVVHAQRIMRFFRSALARGQPRDTGPHAPCAPIVFSWLAPRGDGATRLDPHRVSGPRRVRGRPAAAIRG